MVHSKIKVVRVLSVLLLIATVAICLGENAQPTAKIPDELRPSLNARLQVFIQAQADGQWNQVSSMLGRYRRGGTGEHLYTPAHKVCLVSQMQAFPMTSFTSTGELYSTEILGVPAAKRWWYVKGEALFKPSSGQSKQNSYVVAYRDKGEWYFTPPNFDEWWEQSHVTEADLRVEHADEVQVMQSLSCPLEIVDVHAHLDHKFLSLLDVTYKVKESNGQKGESVLSSVLQQWRQC